MLAHQCNVPVAWVQHLEHHTQLLPIVIRLRGEGLSLVIGSHAPAHVQQPLIDVGACALPQMRPLWEMPVSAGLDTAPLPFTDILQ